MDRRHLVTLTAAAALVIAACSGSGDDADPTTTAAPTTTTNTGVVGDTTTTTEASTVTEETTTTTLGDPVILGLDPIEQTTPLSGEGARPLLSWVPVEGASEYLVMVYDGDDLPYWSTITSESETYVGGPVQIPDGRSGPRISEGYSWSVYADDADGVIIAASPLRPIAP